MKVFNFNAGPAMLPTPVMERAQKEFCDYKGCGAGIMELSHRGSHFEEVIERAEANIRQLMNIGDDYDVLFIQGGATMQFGMLPMNLMLPGGFAEYVDTGMWSSKAMKEAKLFGTVKTLASSKESNYDRIPNMHHWKPSPDASYLHITSNNTVEGTQYHSFLDSPTPLVADMSSDIMSRVINVKQFGMIYAGAQKNLGPSGLALVIIRKDLAKRCPQNVITMLRYETYIESNSLYNTPPTFGIYMLALVTDWLLEIGALTEMEEINDAKSEALYEVLNGGGFYRCPVEPASRSKMNIVFRLPSEELENKFVKESSAAGLIGLKGHRAVGGIRASIYNAMPLAGVEKLIDFMNEFEKKNS